MKNKSQYEQLLERFQDMDKNYKQLHQQMMLLQQEMQLHNKEQQDLDCKIADTVN